MLSVPRCLIARSETQKHPQWISSLLSPPFPLNFLFLRMTSLRYSSPSVEISLTPSLSLPSFYFGYQSFSLLKFESPTSYHSIYHLSLWSWAFTHWISSLQTCLHTIPSLPCCHLILLCRSLGWFLVVFWIACSVTLLCSTLCDPMDCSTPGSSVHGIFHARRLEWVAISYSSPLD